MCELIGLTIPHLGESEIGKIINVTLQGLLSIPTIVLLASLMYRGNITSREVRQRVVDSISESTAGLSGALTGGTLMLINSINSSKAETNIELLGPGLIAATGAALSAALVKRAFANRSAVPTNLENIATEQSNIQEQNMLFNCGVGKRSNKFIQSALKQSNCIVDFIVQNVLFYI